MVERMRTGSRAKAEQPESPVASPQAHLEHLLKVAESVTQDANRTWADIWAEMKCCVTPNGLVSPKAAEGFTPACGWPEFLEKFWLLKHYIDSIQRICREH